MRYHLMIIASVALLASSALAGGHDAAPSTDCKEKAQNVAKLAKAEANLADAVAHDPPAPPNTPHYALADRVTRLRAAIASSRCSNC